MARLTETQRWVLRTLAKSEWVRLTVYLPTKGKPTAWIWRQASGASTKVGMATVEVLRKEGWLDLVKETAREWEYRISAAGRAALAEAGETVQESLV